MDEKILKLKSNINNEILSTFEKSSLVDCKFLPINVKGEFLYAVGCKKTKLNQIKDLVQILLNCETKFIFVSDEDFDSLLNSVFSELEHSQPAQAEQSSQPVQPQNPMEVAQKTVHVEPEPPQVPRTFSEMNKAVADILYANGEITEVQMMEALEDAKKRREPVGSTLHKLGYVNLESVKAVLKSVFNQDVVTLEMFQEQEKYVKLLPEDFIRENRIIPLFSDGKMLKVGIVEPYNTAPLKEIVYMTGQNPVPIIMTSFEFDSCIDKFFSQEKKDSELILKKLEQEASNLNIEDSIWDQIDKELQENSSTVAEFVNKILTDAIELKASDIHIEPRLKNHVVRYRIDGILQHAFDLPAKIEQPVLTRFKVLSRMNIAEHRRPQDGTFTINYNEKDYDFRINSLPVSGQEKMVIRILAPAVSLNAAEREIKLMGATEQDIQKIKHLVASPNGIILTSGPTGSGKTTTLYSILKNLNTEEVNITTIEDPIEIKLEGVNQSQVNVKAGITFASCMRAILRQDPDIILVGEIRDYETLEVAISAALTGHLVLSTVHTNSAAATLTRLIEMGAKDYLVSATLMGVISQRLVRKLCPACKQKYHASFEEASQIFSDPDEAKKLCQQELYKAKGCNQCNLTGYKGRMGVYEILPITKEIRKLISQGAHDIEIEDSAIATGMKTLSQSCLNHILHGETTIAEYVRVLGLATD